MKQKQPEKLKTGLVRTNVYIHEVAPLVDKKSIYHDKYYLSMEEKIGEDNALRHVVSEIPYEITPDYVNSFTDSADYRRDPVAAVINSTPRQNLGDVTEFQKINELDDSQAAALFAQLKERFAKAVKEKDEENKSSSASKPGLEQSEVTQ